MKKSKSDMAIVILGAGIAGLCQAIKLKQAGFDNITIFEKADDIGGTWRENTYPGCSCDVPMHMYEYSFEMLPTWSKKFVPSAEIKRYVDYIADKYNLRQHIKLNKEIVSAHFEEASGLWELTLRDDKKVSANVFIAGSGQLHRAHWPDIDGQESFSGSSWHSAEWNHNVELKGKRVGVIGNGASAIQFVPEIAKQVGAEGQIEIFQRSASWVTPRPQRDFKSWEKWLYRLLPWTMKLQRYKIYWQGELLWLAFHKQSEKLQQLANKEMNLYVKDEDKLKALTPDYKPGCKRMLFASDWWPTMALDFIKINTSPIDSITSDGVKTQTGFAPLDILIYSTGFSTTTFLGPMKMTGLANRDLRSVWSGGAEAYLGISVSGFPNFFMLYGPNTNLGHNSIIFMIECQANYITQCVQRLHKKNLLYMDVKTEVQKKFNTKVQADNASSVFASGCTSWYKTADGKVTNNWANHTFVYWWQTRKLKPADYNFRPRNAVPQETDPIGVLQPSKA